MRETHIAPSANATASSRRLSPLLALPLALLCARCGEQSDSFEVAVDTALLTAVNSEGTAAVIINLPDPGVFETRALRKQAIERAQQAVLDELGSDFSPARRYGHVPALAGTITQAGLERLRCDKRVRSVQLDGKGSGQLKEALPAIGGDRAQQMFSVTGKGVRVAVLDTGADTDHPDLMGAIIAQQCFTRGDCPPTRGNQGTSAEDDHGHGSNVTGIVASRGMLAGRGFAPAAELVIVKVNDQNDSGVESDWIAGLDWVYDNLATNRVKVVNLSLGTNAMYSGNCDAQEPALASAIKSLTDAGVTVFAASGNRGSSTQMGAPACNSNVIAVGATYDSDVGHQPPSSVSYSSRWGSGFGNCADDATTRDLITCFTNSNDQLSIVAPGAPITSDSLNGRTESYWGTSQESPVAAGVAALMLECAPTLKPTAIKDIMQRTGMPLTDAKNGKSFPSLRAFEAVQAACMSGAMGPMGTGGNAAGASGSAGMLPGTSGAGAAGAVAPPFPQAGALAAGASGPGTGMSGPTGLPAATGGANNAGSAPYNGAGTTGERAGSSAAGAAGGVSSLTNAQLGSAGGPAALGDPRATAPVPAPGCSCRVSGMGADDSPAKHASGGLSSLALVAIGWAVRRRRRA